MLYLFYSIPEKDPGFGMYISNAVPRYAMSTRAACEGNEVGVMTLRTDAK